MIKRKLTPDELKQARKQAHKLLRSLRFFNELLAALKKDGLVGEELNALVVFIVVVSRLLPRPLALFVRGVSSAGKNALVKQILRLIPRDAYREITSTSEAAWHYSKNDFRHRVIYDQERDDAGRAARPMRLLISEDKLVKMVTEWVGGQRQARRYVARGPVASISTTNRNNIQVDDLNRHLSIFMDTSPEQTREIMRQYTKPTSRLTREELRTWRTVQELLKEKAREAIVFPDWFDTVAKAVVTEEVRLRRYYPAFAEGCRTVCLIRSFASRQKPKESRHLMVDFADYAITALMFDHAFVQSLNREDGQAEATRRLVERLSDKQGRGVSASDVAQDLGISLDRAYAALRRAERAGVIQRANKPEQRNRKLFVTTARCRFVPDPKDLFQKLGFNERVRFVHPVSGEWVVYRHRRD